MNHHDAGKYPPTHFQAGDDVPTWLLETHNATCKFLRPCVAFYDADGVPHVQVCDTGGECLIRVQKVEDVEVGLLGIAHFLDFVGRHYTRPEDVFEVLEPTGEPLAGGMDLIEPKPGQSNKDALRESLGEPQHGSVDERLGALREVIGEGGLCPRCKHNVDDHHWGENGPYSAPCLACVKARGPCA